MTAAGAELLADRGEAAAGAEFFRCRPFLDAEGATHTLRIGGGEGDVELVAPLIVREIDGGLGLDAVSPYGYPGLVPVCRGGRRGSGAAETTAAPAALDPARIDWGGTGLVSVFLRHRLGPPPLLAATERNVVQIADPTLPRKSRPSDRRQIRRNVEAGYELALVAGPDASPAQRAGFLAVYEQTMRRAGAAEHYFFGAAYFDRILEADRTWLALALAPGGELAAASIAVVSDGYLHYYLSGTADARLREAPMKNVVALLVEHAGELGLPLNLGGGLAAGDALEEFKRGFANRIETWLTSELVCDPDKYELLSAGKPPGPFFPAYRA
ncbi:MAG: GNAT family N-acetyltransferase [Syntrophothermus sp.]